MKLITSKYPKRKKLQHTGDSTIIYETGNRSLDYDSSKSFEDLVEETEGKGASSSQMLTDKKPLMKKVPKSDNQSYPTELAFDEKVLSGLDFTSKLKPSVEDVLDVARTITSAQVRAQLYSMIFTDGEWLSEFLEITR